MVFTETFSDEYPSLKTYTSPVKPAERQIVGREVEMDRVMAAMMRPELCNVMLLAEAGSGKALADDTLIPVDDDREYLNMGDLRPGDYVLDEYGIPTEVLKVFKQGLKDAFEVRLTDGSHVVCNDEHIWQVYINEEVKVLTLREMLDSNESIVEYQIPVFDGGKAQSYHWVNIESVEDLHRQVPMTCIYVDAPSHLFQCTKRRIVTHNTALVQGTMMKDDKRYYLEVDLSHMIADLNDPNQMADKLKVLFSEAQKYCATEEHEVVLFIDEFHQIVQLSAAAVEALKPLLADSGTRGIRVIAATTYVEFRKWISPNQPLVERLQRINLEAPSKEMVVQILKGMARRYGVDNQFYNNHLFEMIYEYTNRYIPANAQPRKSILVLDSMVGWYRYSKRKLNTRLLADVIYESEGVNVAFRVDANSIKRELDEHVFAQQFATRMIENRLQICVSDLNDKTKPMASFLFTGSTGVGKTEVTKQLARILFNDERRLIRFDMTEFANESSLDTFKRELTARVWERPYSIVLLDEIEKACAPVTRILLQVLDDGRLSDENNREVSFINAYIILTTNAGSEIYKTMAQYDADDEGSGKMLHKYDKLIRESIATTAGSNRFPPELLGRIDTIVPFQPLSEETQRKIVKSKLKKLARDVREKHSVDVAIKKRVVDYIVMDNLDTDSNAGGARAAIAKLDSEVTTTVAKYVNTHPDHTHICVDIEGKMAFEDKAKLESEAYVVVYPVAGTNPVTSR